jgi:hypothetical protein
MWTWPPPASPKSRASQLQQIVEKGWPECHDKPPLPVRRVRRADHNSANKKKGDRAVAVTLQRDPHDDADATARSTASKNGGRPAIPLTRQPLRQPSATASYGSFPVIL